MSHLSDKDIDRLSREAAEQFDVESSTSGWEALEKKLDKELPTEKSRRRRRWFWWIGSLLLVLGISGLLYGLFLHQNKNEGKPVLSSTGIQNTGKGSEQQMARNANQQALPGNNVRINKDASSSTQPVNATSSSQPGNASSSPQPANATSSSQPGNVSSPSEVNDPSKADRSQGITVSKPTQATKQPSILDKYRTKNPSSITSIKTNNPTTIYPSAKPTPQDQNLKALSNELVITPGNKEINTGKRIIEGKNIELQIIDRKHSFSVPSPAQIDSSLSFLALKPVNTPSTLNNPSIKIPSKFKPYFEIGALVGSDFSNVRFYGSDKPGFNTGLSIGYQFLPRWQLATGITYTVKKYSAKGNDYKPANDYWTNYVKMDFVSGECSMWEIPLLIRYSFSESQRSKWFLTGGLSSYLMKKETYDLYYTENGIYQSRHRSYPSDKKYFFSIVHLAGGYQRHLTERLSLQLEPYFNMPMKGLGYGRMQINSFGTNLSLIFKIP